MAVEKLTEGDDAEADEFASDREVGTAYWDQIWNQGRDQDSDDEDDE